MNSAVIKESSGKSVEELVLPGLCRMLLKHEVKATSAEYIWDGPRITREEWAKMMAFFEWTYDTEKSEAQVRWYAHPHHGWRCWAFPQKGGTGMTTKELGEHPKLADQRGQFPSSDGWQYFMTVHHHCSSSAFQSGVDEADEKNVDGIHITIGNMDKSARDIHIRMYLRGHKFEPRMNHFWDIGELVEQKADECHRLFGYYPSEELNKVARAQMAKSHALLLPDWKLEKDGEKFPVEWKENYIVDRPVVVSGGTSFSHFDGKHWCYHCKSMEYHQYNDCPVRLAEIRDRKQGNGGTPGKTNGGAKNSGDFLLAATLRDIVSNLQIIGLDEGDINDVLIEALDGANAKAFQFIFAELADSKIDPDDMGQFYTHLIEAKEAKEEAELDAKEEAEDKKQQGLIQGQDPHSGWYGDAY